MPFSLHFSFYCYQLTDSNTFDRAENALLGPSVLLNRRHGFQISQIPRFNLRGFMKLIILVFMCCCKQSTSKTDTYMFMESCNIMKDCCSLCVLQPHLINSCCCNHHKYRCNSFNIRDLNKLPLLQTYKAQKLSFSWQYKLK